MSQSKRRNKQLLSALKMVAPGTVLRDGIENVLRAKTGGLIVLSDADKVRDITRGGFNINDELNPARLYELAKMDGAIILDESCKMIWKANVQLVPSIDVEVHETGIRHRTAARTALETGATVIAVSQRRSTVTLYNGDSRFVLEDISDLLARAGQALRTLERYCIELNKELKALDFLEFSDTVLARDVVKVVQRFEMVKFIEDELDFYLLQMGDEGSLVKMQKDELTSSIDDDYINLLLDYTSKTERRSASALIKKIRDLSDGDVDDAIFLAKFLEFGSGNEVLDNPVRPGGYRILDHIPRLPQQTIGKIVEFFAGDFREICEATVETLDKVEGIGRVRANMIRRSLDRQREEMGASGIVPEQL